MRQWQETLEQIGYPTTAIVIDFETYYDNDYLVTGMTIPEYVMDGRFAFTGCGIGEMDRNGLRISFVAGPLVDDRIGALGRHKWGDNFEKVTIVMQNAPFDAYILLKKFGIDAPYIIDTKDLSKHLEPRASARLKDMAPRYGLDAKGDTSIAKGKHWEDMSVEETTAWSEYTKQDIKLESQLFEIMLPMINNPADEILLMKYTRNLILKSSIKFDFDLASALLTDMKNELDSKVLETGYTKDQLSSDLSFVEILQKHLPDGEHVPTKAHKRPGKNMTALLGKTGVGPALAKDDTGMKNLLIHKDDTVRTLAEARQSVGSWPTHIKRVERMYTCALANGGTLPIATQYYGAHTGRWTGGWGYNVLNLGARSHRLVNEVRHLLVAKLGYRMILKDWKQIEARFLAWWAGQDDLVEDFANGIDTYSVFASDIFKTRVRNVKDNDPPAIKAFLAPKRHLGKETMLSGGYGMGPSTFFERMMTNDSLRALIIKGVYTKKTAKDVIYGYRKKYSKIPELWDEVEKGFKWIVKVPRDATYSLPKGFSLSSVGDTVTMNLPTGRQMVYHECRIKQGAKGSSISWKYGHLWGGTLVENAVQSACRDIMTRSWIECARAGICICFQLYDELVAMAPLPKVKSTEKMMEDIMTTTPDWAKGLPLATDTKILERYAK